MSLLYTVEAVLGIGFLIFIHELGHFVAAKRCGVRVEIFSLGFGPRLLGIQRGDTDYRLSLVPLGGYVKMAGESVLEGTTGAPWEFQSKSVGERGLVFAAGVVMNTVFAFVAFILAFHFGVTFMAPIVGDVAPASAAAVAGIEAEDEILEVNGRRVMDFGDLRAEIAFAPTDRVANIKLRRRGEIVDVKVRPEFSADEGYARIGIQPLVVPEIDGLIQVDGVEGVDQLRRGDRIVAVNGEDLTPWIRSWSRLREQVELHAGKPLALTIERDGERQDVSVVPAIHHEAVARFGAELAPTWDAPEVLDVRTGDGAWAAGLEPGDRILAVDGTAVRWWVDFYNRWWAASAKATVLLVRRGGREIELGVVPQVVEEPSWLVGLEFWGPQVVTRVVADSPASRAGLLPGDILVGVQGRLETWAKIRRVLNESAGATLPLLVERQGQRIEVPVVPAFDGEARSVRIGVEITPTAVVHHVVAGGPADQAGIRVGDRVVGVEGHAVLAAVEADAYVRLSQGRPLTLTLRSDSGAERTVALTPVPRGILGVSPKPLTREVRETGLSAAVYQGCRKAYLMVRQIFVFLNKLFTRDVSAKTVGGPVMIYQASRSFAEYGLVNLLYFLGIVSINLAVLNALPIPVLDGGHLLFLAIEKLKGRPVSERTQAIANYVGLALLVGLMVLATSNDLRRIFQG